MLKMQTVNRTSKARTTCAARGLGQTCGRPGRPGPRESREEVRYLEVDPDVPEADGERMPPEAVLERYDDQCAPPPVRSFPGLDRAEGLTDEADGGAAPEHDLPHRVSRRVRRRVVGRGERATRERIGCPNHPTASTGAGAASNTSEARRRPSTARSSRRGRRAPRERDLRRGRQAGRRDLPSQRPSRPPSQQEARAVVSTVMEGRPPVRRRMVGYTSPIRPVQRTGAPSAGILDDPPLRAGPAGRKDGGVPGPCRSHQVCRNARHVSPSDMYIYIYTYVLRT